MKHAKSFSLLVLFSLLVFITSSVAAAPVPTNNQPAQERIWQTGVYPPPDFQYARHDGAFVPGLDAEPWANKIYFMGGRTSPPTESPHIWMFDPVANVFTDTGADVVEDVSNYNANLILDDGTGRGPAVYVIGGTDKDHGGITIGMVQRYYPQTNEIESLPSNDNWNGKVGGYLVAAMGTAVVNDIIYVYGGWETSITPYFSSETWAFDPKQPVGSRWTNLQLPMHTARSYIMSAMQDNKIYSIGGVGSYVGGELDPVDSLEVLDIFNLGIGWTELAPMPTPGGEGRAYGFDSDTRGVNSPWDGKIYVVAPNDWPSVSSEVMIYDIPTDTWRDDLPELPTARADLAGSFIPICTDDPTDGLPGLWTFGGRVNESCDPPLGPTEYYPLPCDGECIGFISATVSGPTLLPIDEVGIYTAITQPADASNPVSLMWSNGQTTPSASYSWDTEGWYTVEVTGTNCSGGSVVTGTLDVTVYNPCNGLESGEITGPASLLVGETGNYTVTWTPNDATLPIDILWSNLVTDTVSAYTWDVAGVYDVTVSLTNCGGTVEATMQVEVVQPSYPVWMPLVAKAVAR